MPNITTQLDFRKELIRLDVVNIAAKPGLFFKECQPKILVITDSLSFQATSDFGLTQFVSTLASSTIHGMTPIVQKASRGGALAGADIPNFRFDDPGHGLLKARYDVVFILGFTSEFGQPPGVGSQLPQSELDAIARFMQAGGGVFATGDHQSLGAAICRDIPRVREMRFWKESETPNIASDRRLSTNVSGPNEVEDFDDQSDRRPQALYPNFRTRAGNPTTIGRPAAAHPVLQLPPTLSVSRPVIEVFPDHPHEGECRLPSSLGSTFSLDGATVPEWPQATAGGALPPEIVAMTMSHGSGFASGPTGPKTALQPRAFIAICAYDGQLANVGRVVTDSTWHHFVNINLDGAASGSSALQNPGPPRTDTEPLSRIRQYYRNLATWLMPKNVRRCLRFPLVLDELTRFPLFEELVVPVPPNPPDPAGLVTMGEQVVAALARRLPAWEVEALLGDALADAVGERAAEKLLEPTETALRVDARTLALGAVGALTVSTVTALAKLSDPKEIVPHQTFEGPARKAMIAAVRPLILRQRHELTNLATALGALEALETPNDR